MSEHPTPDQIMQVGLGFWASKTLLSAVEMELFTELAKHPEDAEALRDRLGLHPRSSRDFLDALVALGFLERRDGIYSNTPSTDLFLDKRKPSYSAGFWRWPITACTASGGISPRRCERAASRTRQSPGRRRSSKPSTPIRPASSDSSRDDRAQPRRQPGDRTDSSPGMSTRRSSTSAPPKATSPCRSRSRTHTSRASASTSRGRRRCSRSSSSTTALQGRLRFVGGDFFSDDLPQADVLIMGHILHDWNLDEKRMLIGKAHEHCPTAAR